MSSFALGPTNDGPELSVAVPPGSPQKQEAEIKRPQGSSEASTTSDPDSTGPAQSSHAVHPRSSQAAPSLSFSSCLWSPRGGAEAQLTLSSR